MRNLVVLVSFAGVGFYVYCRAGDVWRMLADENKGEGRVVRSCSNLTAPVQTAEPVLMPASCSRDGCVEKSMVNVPLQRGEKLRQKKKNTTRNQYLRKSKQRAFADNLNYHSRQRFRLSNKTPKRKLTNMLPYVTIFFRDVLFSTD